MKFPTKLLAIGMLVGMVFAGLMAAGALSARSAPAASGPFVLHEWGTFTNFSGANGAYLDYRPLTEDRLPAFVENPWLSYHPYKRLIVARQRMETPVAYFYSDVPRDVQVRVDFPGGLLTDWYPPVQQFAPRRSGKAGNSPKDSFLDWGTVRIVPPADFAKLQLRGPKGTPVPAELPQVTDDDHYGLARETDAAVLETPDPIQPRLHHYEKFLFYRGIGIFNLPVKLAALGSDRFEVTNFGDAPVGNMFLVQIDEGTVRYSRHAGVAPHTANYLELPPQIATIETLAEDMTAALVTAGLYEKEAHAMVNTWRSSWFGEPGTRLLYLVPRPWTDAVIPLTVTPPPDEVVRVLVGRMEILTPEAGAEIVSLVRESGTCFNPEAEPLASRLTALGRFAEPALESLVPQSGDSDVREKLILLKTAAQTR